MKKWKKLNQLIKSTLSLLLAAAFLLCPCGAVYAQREQAVENTASAPRSGATVMEQTSEAVPIKVTCNAPRLNCNKMTDNDEGTYETTNKKTVFTITSEKYFYNLYLKFELPCIWKVTLPDDTVLNGGEYGFVHEYLPLGKAVRSVELTLPKGARFTDIYAFTDGTPPDWVQVWEPPCETADLLVLPAHADDEHLWFGGALPYYAGELGYQVQVVYLTNHNNATIRNHERLNGLWTVGVTHYPVIGDFLDVPETRSSLEDAANIFGYEKVLIFQVEMLRRFKPKVVLGHDINGEYGHGAHKLDAKTLLEALELTDDPDVFPASSSKYGTCQVQKCYLHLWKQNQITMYWSDIRLPKLGNRTALEMAKAGFACHKSQKLAVKVEESGPYDCRKFGLVYTTVGSDTPGENDMFEHVQWPEDAPPEIKTSDNIWDDVPEELRPSDSDLSPDSSTNTQSVAKKGLSKDMVTLLLVTVGGIAVIALFGWSVAAIQRRIQAKKGVNNKP